MIIGASVHIGKHQPYVAEFAKENLSLLQGLVLESEKELEEGLERFAHQPATVSFTDCLVMVLADLYGTKLIFGFDEVFEKNGYQLPEATENQQAA